MSTNFWGRGSEGEGYKKTISSWLVVLYDYLEYLLNEVKNSSNLVSAKYVFI